MTETIKIKAITHAREIEIFNEDTVIYWRYVGTDGRNPVFDIATLQQLEPTIQAEQRVLEAAERSEDVLVAFSEAVQRINTFEETFGSILNLSNLKIMQLPVGDYALEEPESGVIYIYS